MASITAMLSTLAIGTVLGYSVQHRPIELVHVAGPGPRVLVVGCIHGNECAGMAVVAALRKVHPREDLWLVPTFNPDGLAHDTRQNADGIDLNRNFPTGWRPFGPPWSVYAAGPGRGRSRRRGSSARSSRGSTRASRSGSTSISTSSGPTAAARRPGAGTRSSPACASTTTRGSPARPRTGRAGCPDGASSFTVELPAGPLSAAGVARQVRAVLGVSSR